VKRVDWTEKTPWDEILRQGEQEDIVVMREGHAVALLTPFDDDDLRWYDRESDPSFLATIADARRQFQQGKTIGRADLKRELGIDGGDEAMDLDRVLDLLDLFHQRATYTAVAGVVHGNPRTLMQSRPRDPRHSWVVVKKTGQPTGFTAAQKHPALAERPHVITDPDRLREWLRSPR
jgi:hypothetical protein